MLKPVSLLAAALLCLLVPVLAVADDDGIAIDKTNFPDILFREYVSLKWDENHNGKLCETEISAATV